ncbi:MAG TPA: hypothetical protein DCK76_08865, partial [Desulfotomaculum sp.]|nr:hypothetical protein [Desulfotomaculum sp.]
KEWLVSLKSGEDACGSDRRGANLERRMLENCTRLQEKGRRKSARMISLPFLICFLHSLFE